MYFLDSLHLDMQNLWYKKNKSPFFCILSRNGNCEFKNGRFIDVTHVRLIDDSDNTFELSVYDFFHSDMQDQTFGVTAINFQTLMLDEGDRYFVRNIRGTSTLSTIDSWYNLLLSSHDGFELVGDNLIKFRNPRNSKGFICSTFCDINEFCRSLVKFNLMRGRL